MSAENDAMANVADYVNHAVKAFRGNMVSLRVWKTAGQANIPDGGNYSDHRDEETREADFRFRC